MTYRARWVLPINRPPIAGGWVTTQQGRILDVGDGRPPGPVEDLGDVALMPGLVNSHTHLELSWMAGRVPPAASMNDWIGSLLALRRAGPDGGDQEILESMARAAVTMRATGTVLAGDVSNTLASPPVLEEVGLGGVVFHELLGFNAANPASLVRDAWHRIDKLLAGRLRYSVVAHAPYSVSPALVREIVRRADATPLTIHLGESSEEIEFLRKGGGPIQQTLQALGVWTSKWRAPGCDPVQYVSDLGYLRPGTLVVHGVHLTDAALERLAAVRAVLVTCPRSNLWVGAGSPRLKHFYASGVRVAIGTDSLASTATLNMFDELAEMRRLAPELAAATLLDSATRRGAEALGFDRDFGTIAPGKRSVFAAVEVPARVRDVEEYLVGGVPAEAIRPVD